MGVKVLKTCLQQNREHIPSCFSMSTISSVRNVENKQDLPRGIDCMKRFYECLREHAMKIINFKTKQKKILTIRNHMKMQISVIFVEKKLKIDELEIKYIVK